MVGVEGRTKSSQSERAADPGGKSRACLRLLGPTARRRAGFTISSAAASPRAAIEARHRGARKTGEAKNGLMRQTSDGGTEQGVGGWGGGGGDLLRVVYGPSAAN